jgi:DNA-directed RNA polymerase specialized sigma24 family protein
MLKDDTMRTVALLRVEGYSVEEIADRLNCGKRTIERKLTLIRRTWQETLQTPENDEESK